MTQHSPEIKTTHGGEERVTVRVADQGADIARGELAVVAPGQPWEAVAMAESLLLVQLAWPPEPASAAIRGHGALGRRGEAAAPVPSRVNRDRVVTRERVRRPAERLDNDRTSSIGLPYDQRARNVITLLLCGDVMIGRGIDQIQSRSVDPRLFEPSITSAEGYVRLAEIANGPIPRPVTASYVWGEALTEIDGQKPNARIVNLETAVTTSPAAWPAKDVLFRAHPDNVAVLQAARVDCCALANNHVLDWGYAGLLETLDSLHSAGLVTAGAGRDRSEAQAPAVIDIEAGRVLVLGLGSTTSGIPAEWAATDDRHGVDLVAGGSTAVAEAIAGRLAPMRRPGDVVVASIHWGSNWGYDVPAGQRRLAHELIDVGGVDVIHGHSAHHPLGIEIYHGRLILQGCGDFITDYEGIAGYGEFRDDLVLAYFPVIDPATGRLVQLTMSPFQLRRFRLVRPGIADVVWLRDTLDRHSRPLGVRVELESDGTLRVRG